MAVVALERPMVKMDGTDGGGGASTLTGADSRSELIDRSLADPTNLSTLTKGRKEKRGKARERESERYEERVGEREGREGVCE